MGDRSDDEDDVNEGDKWEPLDDASGDSGTQEDPRAEAPADSEDDPEESSERTSGEERPADSEDDPSGSDGSSDSDEIERERTTPTGSPFGGNYDEVEDAEEYVDEDEEVPDWVEEAKEDGESGESSPASDEDSVEDDEWDEEEGMTAKSAPKTAGKGTPTSGQPAAAGGGGFGGATAPDDEEMPLTEHVEEMALRFMAVGLVVIGIGAITLFYADELINFLWYSFLGPGQQTCLQGSFLGGELRVTDACPRSVSPRVYHPLALVLARLKVASLVGIIAALPVAVYQMYRFMRPGLYPRERRYYLAAVPTSLVLAAVGVSFAYFAILPAMFSYFTTYSERAAEIAFGLTETFNLIILMIGFFALVFQIPLLVMLAIMMGVTTRRWLEDRRLYFWGGFAAVAFLFSPDPTGMAPLMVAVTMIGLFEGTLLLLRWTDSDSPLFSPAAFAARRPYAWVLAIVAGYLASSAPVPGSYYEQLPAVVRETLAFNELVAMTPVITAAALILLFEAVAYLVRNYSRNVRVWDVVNRLRFPYWMVALAVGYFASPNPPGLQTVQQLAIPTTEAVAVTIGIIIAFELLILGLRWRKNRA